MFSRQNALKEREYESAEELQTVINKLTISIQRLKAKLSGTEPPPEETEVRFTIGIFKMSLVVRKPVFGISDQV